MNKSGLKVENDGEPELFAWYGFLYTVGVCDRFASGIFVFFNFYFIYFVAVGEIFGRLKKKKRKTRGNG